MRYKNPQFQHVYDTLLKMAADPSSELYWKGQPRRGASHRCAFWDGFNGLPRTPAAIPGTMGMVCFRAGQAWRRKQK